MAIQRVDHIYENIFKIDQVTQLVSVANFHWNRQELYKASHCIARCLELELSKSDVAFVCRSEIVGHKNLDPESEIGTANRFLCFVFLRLCHEICQSNSRCRSFYQKICSDVALNKIESEITRDCFDEYFNFFYEFRLPETSSINQYDVKDNTKRNIGLFVAISIISIGAIYYFSPIEPNNLNTLVNTGHYFHAHFYTWFLMLCITWYFAYLTSKQKRVLIYVDPDHSFLGDRFRLGEIMSFRKDYFFHIFQFFWIPFGLLALASIAAFQDVDPRHFIDAQTGLGEKILRSWEPTWEIFTPWQSSDPIAELLRNDGLVLLFSACAGLAFVINQIRIQKARISRGVNFYWWDWRVDKAEYITRLVMVFFDTFLGVFLTAKVMLASHFLFQLIKSDGLQISYFHPDGTGGLASVVSVYTSIMWIVLIFGIFVICSLYLHRRLEEYRITDALLVAVYLILMANSLYPLLAIDSLIETEKQALISTFANDRTLDADQIEVLNQLQNLFGKWQPSAIKIDLLNSPLLPLIFQAVVILAQFFSRLKKGGSISNLLEKAR